MKVPETYRPGVGPAPQVKVSESLPGRGRGGRLVERAEGPPMNERLITRNTRSFLLSFPTHPMMQGGVTLRLSVLRVLR